MLFSAFYSYSLKTPIENTKLSVMNHDINVSFLDWYRIVIGFVSNARDNSNAAINKCDIELYQFGDTPPDQYAFSFWTSKFFFVHIFSNLKIPKFVFSEQIWTSTWWRLTLTRKPNYIWAKNQSAGLWRNGAISKLMEYQDGVQLNGNTRTPKHLRGPNR